LGDILVASAVSLTDSVPIKVVDVVCPDGMVAIGGGGAVEMGSINEDIGIDVLGPIDALGGTLGSGNAGWRAQATNFFIDSGFNWKVIVFAICLPTQ